MHAVAADRERHDTRKRRRRVATVLDGARRGETGELQKLKARKAVADVTAVKKGRENTGSAIKSGERSRYSHAHGKGSAVSVGASDPTGSLGTTN